MSCAHYYQSSYLPDKVRMVVVSIDHLPPTNYIVKRFHAVCVGEGVVSPCLRRELSIVAVECEQIVQSIHERHPTVVKNWGNHIVLADSVADPAGWIALRFIPFCKLTCYQL